MTTPGADTERRRIEQALSQLGAKAANATDLSRQAKELCRRAEATLVAIQEEIDFLYGSLEGDDPPTTPGP